MFANGADSVANVHVYYMRLTDDKWADTKQDQARTFKSITPNTPKHLTIIATTALCASPLRAQPTQQAQSERWQVAETHRNCGSVRHHRISPEQKST